MFGVVVSIDVQVYCNLIQVDKIHQTSCILFNLCTCHHTWSGCGQNPRQPISCEPNFKPCPPPSRISSTGGCLYHISSEHPSWHLATSAKASFLFLPQVCGFESYCIAGKFGGNYIWRNALQAAKNKYWRNLNLAIGNCAYKFLLRHRVSYGGSPHVVRRLKSKSWKSLN